MLQGLNEETKDNMATNVEKRSTNQHPHTPYKTKVNPNILIIGYARSNCRKGTYVLCSIVGIILHYYPKMNGYKFVWNIREKDELISIDSDLFDIGLPNKFFLRLCKSDANANPNSNPTAPTGILGMPGMTRTTSNRRDTTTNRVNRYKLRLLSFELPCKYWYMICHIELLCHELNEQYSVIWNLCNLKSWIQNGQIETC